MIGGTVITPKWYIAQGGAWPHGQKVKNQQIHMRLAHLLFFAAPVALEVATVISNITVVLPADIQVAELAPWATSAEHSLGPQKATFVLSEADGTAPRATIQVENGAGFIIMRKDGSSNHGSKSQAGPLASGDYIALLTNAAGKSLEGHLETFTMLAGPEAFCSSLGDILTKQKGDVKWGMYCGQVMPIKDAYNKHTFYTIQGHETPTQA